MSSISALESLATHSHAQASKAIGDAGDKLTERLEEKMAELRDFRNQVKSQTKQLQQLIASCETRSTKLTKNSASESQIKEAQDLQYEIAVLDRQIRVIEKTEELKEQHAIA